MDAFHDRTPLVESFPLTAHFGAPVFLKMDALQPSGSFKIRGIGLACSRAVRNRHAHTLVCSSGGNAGMAVAYAGYKLGAKVEVVVPSSTSEYMRSLIAGLGATVHVHGDVWMEADVMARELAQKEGVAYIPPFDHPDIWEGNSSVIIEAAEQMRTKPGAVVCVVGGGGLLCGIAMGLHAVGWRDVPIVAVETEGAHSLNAAVKADKLVTLERITSIAKTLGASRVAQRAFEWTKAHKVVSCTVSDLSAVTACLRFADEHRVLVEPSCGAALAAVYDMLPDVTQFRPQPLLVIVCGGNMATVDYLRDLKTQLTAVADQAAEAVVMAASVARKQEEPEDTQNED